MVFEFSHGDDNAQEMYAGRDDPGDGIGPVDHIHRVIGGVLEQHGDPYKTQGAGANQRHDHGQHGVADAPQGPHARVHEAAQHIGHGHDLQPDQSGLNDGRAGGVQGEQLGTEEVGKTTQGQAQHQHAALHPNQDLPDAVVVAGAHILAGEGDIGLNRRR